MLGGHESSGLDLKERLRLLMNKEPFRKITVLPPRESPEETKKIPSEKEKIQRDTKLFFIH